jgi:hydroxyacylglutathione hydrolase
MKRVFVCLAVSIFLATANIAYVSENKNPESAKGGFSGSHHRIVDTYTFPGFKVIQFTLPVLSVYSYMLVSDGEALMVDPVRDISFYLDTAKKQGVKIKGVYLTHSHADFVAGHMEMVKAVKCPIYQSHKSGARYPIKAVDEDSVVKIGKATLKFMDTPGHTPDGMCCAVYDGENSDSPRVLLTGDVLFVGSVGRPDLMGGTVSAAWLAGAMFDSWTKKLAKLPDGVMVLPAHGAGSLCGTKLSSEPKSTIGDEKKSNPYLKHTNKTEFIAAVLQGLPEAPQYFKHNAKMNREGPPLVDWDAPIPSETKSSAALADPKQCRVVDLREAQSYGAGHVPGALNISSMGRLESWVGTMVPWGTKLVLAGGPERLKEGIFRLHRVGYQADGAVIMDSWLKSKRGVAFSDLVDPGKLHSLMKKGTAPIIVDVRKPAEWEAKRIGTVLNLPLNSLDKLSGLLDPAEPLVVYCRTGYRSSMAVGILERHGFEKAASMDGGITAWIEDKLPVVEGE